MSVALLNTPPVWTNQSIILYHGTTLANAQRIERDGVNPSLGRARTDFARGFYTTTSYRQAWSWAAVLAISAGTIPAVVTISCLRDDLASLATLAFVRGDYDAKDYWSFVWHCRNGAPDHGRGSASARFYDLVYGPVAAFWPQRSAMHDADQVSFHTTAAAAAITFVMLTKSP